MLDPRARALLIAYHNGTRSLEETAQGLMAVRRATGCLELHLAPVSAPAERALVARFTDLVRLEGVSPTGSDPPVV